ncbi:hypothetical protein PHYSODRAFT_307615 [Phytophthora sojae]|uniref:Uncharacterized protein n=1 Tax=Phytophthora sojae (strain P6497) TaxID=1094619 RepID=G5AFF1_PHYSP|nr:hypothetical protein PHYSODRAFT_307615 [Phytophthora sojae]EGZ05941.1 hypothetical protein PHYSODRAFT_307615 [Phytophthora sojae]|eukprot:XP_009538802.1 hypothetical protein PHYSODRAFT_307615 [Phytophthora sojae]
MEETKQLRNHVNEARCLAENAAQARIQAHAELLERRWRQNIQDVVSERIQAHIPSLEEKLGTYCKAEQARLTSSVADQQLKQALQTAVLRVEEVAEHATAETLAEKQEYLQIYIREEIRRTLAALTR